MKRPRLELSPRELSTLSTAGLCLLLLAGCTAGPRPATGAVATTAPGPAARAAGFAFYSDPWVNLHHFLYQWARGASGERFGRDPLVPVREIAEPAGLAAEEDAAWQAALGYYTRSLVRRDLLFDEEMTAWSERLQRAEATGGASLGELPVELAQALRATMPAYRRRWWPGHDEANRRWIAAATVELRSAAGAAALAALAPAYGGSFPVGPPGPAGEVRVDVSAYTNWAGAYTVGTPRLTIASTDPKNQPPRVLEVMLHETSHADRLEQPLHAALAAAFARRGAEPPGGLWHWVIFFTAGELARTALAGREPAYVPYAEHVGLYNRNPDTQRQWDAVAGPWKEHLEGRLGRDAALDQIAAALAETPEGRGGDGEKPPGGGKATPWP